MEYYVPKPDMLKELPSNEKKGFFGNLLRKSSDKVVEKKEKKSSPRFANIFKRSSDDLRRGESIIADDVIISPTPTLASPPMKRRASKEDLKHSTDLARSQDDIESDAYLQKLREMDGRTDEEINALARSITLTEPKNDGQVSPNTRKKNLVANFFSSVSQALKEEFSIRRDVEYGPYPQPLFEDHRQYTVSISAAPFFAAPPPESDMSFEELATFEPVYLNGNGCCINNLPVKKYDGTPLPGEQTTCPVCIAPFEKKEELKSLPCCHFYHKECIDRWLMVGHSCPVCKALVL